MLWRSITRELLTFSQKRPSQDGNAVALNSYETLASALSVSTQDRRELTVCSRMVSTLPSAWITSVLYAFRFHNLPSCRWLVHLQSTSQRTSQQPIIAY